ncbi:MAG: LamG domain-containing protein, partial [Candidatus Brocadiia bacterium]
YGQLIEVAGNVLDRCYGAGVFIFGGKGGDRRNKPLIRVLVHHNKVTSPLLNTNDWGGVETWQGGPWYVYNNVSGNPGGYMNWRYNPDKPGSARFAHAYYMDGSFKNYQFNNIAWGRNNDPSSKYCNTSAFQEIISYQNTVFNNTVFRFFKGTRRQKPEAGRDKFLGNIWQDISGWVFWHAKPTDAEADPNVYQIGETGETFAYHTNAYADNIFHSIAGKIGVFEASGVPRPELEQMRKALQMHDAMAASVGVQAEQPPLRDAEAHDFRPAAGSAAIGRGVRVFVPWALYAMVGEWNFTRNNADPTVVIDEHWYMTPYHVGREQYWTRPTYPLEAVNVDAEDYVAGPLEDWTQGALRLNGQDQYLVLSDEQIDEPFRLKGQAVEGGWATVTLPTAAVPGEPFDVVVELAEPHEGQQVAVHLHWLKKAGFGGFNAWGGLPKAATSVGPHTFTFTAEDKPDLATFSATVFLSPTGDWGDRTMVDRIHIEKGQSGSEPETREVALGGEQATRWITVSGQDLKTPETYNSSFLIEAYFRTDAGASGVLVEKMGDAGYSVLLDDDGLPRFSVRHGDAAATVRGKAPLNDGEWHHLIAEADREAGELRLYLDGALNATTDGLGSWSLANKADLHVGGTPDGRCLAAELEFVRIARGTLADARTTIEELHEWQFNGPFLRDFTGREPVGKREAGALELTE